MKKMVYGLPKIKVPNQLCEEQLEPIELGQTQGVRRSRRTKAPSIMLNECKRFHDQEIREMVS